MSSKYREITKLLAMGQECFEDEVRRLVSAFAFMNKHKITPARKYRSFISNLKDSKFQHRV